MNMALQFAIEECCRACGGHGFSQASALGALYENYLAQVTLGGRQSHDLSLNKQVLGNPNEKSTVKTVVILRIFKHLFGPMDIVRLSWLLKQPKRETLSKEPGVVFWSTFIAVL
ncbi:hypothetical protein H4Q26_002267 [Puccinia striiformis f. sp. tritici PST-130]|nr:hypothetical protein H4Q26_002267 [Puccinia striiformis f. sp. tritici PST-130]